MTRLEALLSIARGEEVAMPDPPPFTEIRVNPSGPLDAAIAVIGEAPGYEEVEADPPRPFVGKSGKMLRSWARYAKVSLNDCYLDNVYPYYPPAGKIKNIEVSSLEAEAACLIARLERLTDVRVIVPTGNIALKALLGLEGITKHRGSIYQATIGSRQVKVIPIIHPAAVLRGQTIWNRRGHLDWLRIAEESQTSYHGVERCYEVNPTEPYVQEFYERATPAGAIAIDIETKPSEGRILCVGFSIRADEGLVLTWDVEWQQEYIRKLCALPVPNKLWWNYLYDHWYLRRENVEIAGRQLDGMTLLHAVRSTDNVSLAYAASILTREPFWKNESKDADDKTAEENWEQFKTYCAKDVCVTRELIPAILKDYTAAQLDFHREHYEELAEPMLDLMLQGIRIDHPRRRQVLKNFIDEARQSRDSLAQYNDGKPLFSLTTQRDKLVYEKLRQGMDSYEGWSAPVQSLISVSVNRINAKTVSKSKLKDMLYGKYGIPAVFKKRDSGEETETADIFTLRKLRYDYRDNAEISNVLDLAIDHSKTQKLSPFITDDKFDEDGRMRFSLSVKTETRRLASSSSPRGKKVNSQNIPRDPRVRSLILPEEGHIILGVDGSAAEARVCFVRTHDPELRRLAGLRSDVYDQHRHTGVIVGFAPTKEETPENFAKVYGIKRQVCKNISHGSQRSMQGSTLAQTILREGLKDEEGNLIVYDEETCNDLIESYHKRFPAIRQWHQRVRAQLRKDKCLTNAWGFTWPVEFYEMNDELCRRGYSFLLQSDIAFWLNNLFKKCWYWLRDNRMQSRIMLQEHDGLILSCAPDEAYDVATFLRDNGEAPWECDGEDIWIPVEFSVAPNWGKGEEFKVLPERVEFDAVVAVVRT